MRTLLAALIGLSLLAAPAFAGDHHGGKEKKVSVQITITDTVKIGNKTLTPGKYVIVCDHETITFTLAETGKKITFPCRGKDLGSKSTSTEIHLSSNGGEKVVTTLFLEGSTIEHTF